MYKLPKGYRWAVFGAAGMAPRSAGGLIASASALARAQESAGALRVVLYGPPGSGKTSLAIAIGRAAMARRDDNGMFCTSLELDKWRAEARRGQGEAADVQRAIDVPVLVLDELGAEDGKDSTVVEVIHERHAAQRQTIVTFALAPKALGAHYSDGIARRLLGGAVRIDCAAERQPKPSSEAVLTLPERPRAAQAADDELVPCPAEVRKRLDQLFASIGRGPSAPAEGP